MNKSSPPEYRAFGFIMIAALIGYVVNGMFQDVTVMPMIHMFLFFLAGMLESVIAKCEKPYTGLARTSGVSQTHGARQQSTPSVSSPTLGNRRATPAL